MTALLDELSVPVVLAPLAGGPATVELAVAVSEAGGLGFLAAGYRSAQELAEQVAAYRALSGRPFGVNVFVPPAAPSDPSVYAAYVEELGPEAARAGVRLGAARSDDDDFEAKLALVTQLEVPLVSFVFGCPATEVIGALQHGGASVWVTVTTPAEALTAASSGADGLIVQGGEAGGHRGGFGETDESEIYGLLALLQLIGARVDRPLIAAGGIVTGRGVAAVLAAGASAAALGTAFLRTPEAGTSEVHREAVAGSTPTGLTRAFSGKLARGVLNRFMREHDERAPAAYPEIHHVTSPLRQAARRRGDGDQLNLWAGQAHELARAAPAADVVREIADEARRALALAGARLSP